MSVRDQAPERAQDFAPVPPQSLEAERSVLGALIQDAEVVERSLVVLRPDDFYGAENRVIFEAIRALHERKSAVDLITLDTELRDRGQIDGIGGPDYLMRLTQEVPSTANTAYYIGILKDKSVRRQLISASSGIARLCHQQQLPLEDILNQSEKQIFDITMRQMSGTELEHIQSILLRAYDKMGELARNQGRIPGVTTGFRELDSTLTGMHGGEFILIGARPSMGKTSFAINIAAAAARAGKTVAVFSLEMPKEQIVMRIMCGEARVNMQAVRSGTLRESEWQKLGSVLPRLSKENLYIDDTAGLTPSQLRSRCRRLKLEKGLDLAVIDYLQLMAADGRTENRQLEVSEISRRLKALAMELDIPLIACAQLSRANTQRSDKKPMLSDLRDSGSIEQDADIVMFLHRPDYYNEKTQDDQKNTAELIIAKQRNGPLGTIRLNWLSECTMFTDLKLVKE